MKWGTILYQWDFQDFAGIIAFQEGLIVNYCQFSGILRELLPFAGIEGLIWELLPLTSFNYQQIGILLGFKWESPGRI